MSEEWRTVPDTKGYYQVSTLGRMRRMGGTPFCKETRIVTGAVDGHGYVLVWLAIDGNRKLIAMHSLITLAFLGTRPEKADVNHINGIRNDNRLANLEYVTRRENVLHGMYVLGNIETRSKNHAGAKVSPENVQEIRELHKSGNFTLKQIADTYGVAVSTITRINARKTWDWVA